MTDETRLKIGQMLMAGFPSPELDEQARRLVEDFYVGNFVLFARNFHSLERVCAMCSDLSRLVLGR